MLWRHMGECRYLSRPWNQMKMSGQLYAPAALPPGKMPPLHPLGKRLVAPSVGMEAATLTCTGQNSKLIYKSHDVLQYWQWMCNILSWRLNWIQSANYFVCHVPDFARFVSRWPRQSCFAFRWSRIRILALRPSNSMVLRNVLPFSVPSENRPVLKQETTVSSVHVLYNHSESSYAFAEV
jgi:hypothetical protein